MAETLVGDAAGAAADAGRRVCQLQQQQHQQQQQEQRYPSCWSTASRQSRSGCCSSNNNNNNGDNDDDRRSHKPQKGSGSGNSNNNNSISSGSKCGDQRIRSINGRNINYKNKRCLATPPHHHRRRRRRCQLTAPAWPVTVKAQRSCRTVITMMPSFCRLLACLVLFAALAVGGAMITRQELSDYDYGYGGLEMHKRSEQQQQQPQPQPQQQEQLEEAPANVTVAGGGVTAGSDSQTTEIARVGGEGAVGETSNGGGGGGAPAAAAGGAGRKSNPAPLADTDYAPYFKNPKNMGNIYSKPSGTSVQLSCAAQGKPEPNITWTRNGTKIYRHMGRIKKTKWSISMEDLVPEDSDMYTCLVCNYLGCIQHSSKLMITDRVNHKPIALIQPKNLTLALNGSGEMECKFLSDLHSKKAWWFTACNATTGCSTNRTFLKEDVDKIELHNVDYSDEGWYTCVEINGLGQSASGAYLRVVNASMLEPNATTVTKIIRSNAMWVSIVITVVILLVLLMILFVILYVMRRLKHEKLLKQRIETVHQWTKKVIIYKPASGDSSGSMDTMIMPVVKIEKQRTTVLQSSNSEPAPFNEYEFPLDSNWEIVRNQLSLGATLGEGAFGRVVMAEVNNAIVAVKMVKEGHTDDDIASLVREMEVMKIIGKHINIINLLGCCSQNGPLYVIVEFAPYGNLKDFLNKNRPFSAKDAADHPERQAPPQQHGPQHQLTEKHLISFAFQIARGMEYLASRRCIHRDLAARNVLVSDDYVMKIADFGLARDIQDTDYYRKNTNGRLPIKWMAPESLQDKFYDSQSDVWSYGILLWEIMTFGAQPYPTIMSAEELYTYLMSGQRMEKPSKCSLNIYMLMRQCWHFDASARPTFTEIVENLDKLLLANEDYLDVAVANLETPPSSSDEESDVESLRYHYK